MKKEKVCLGILFLLGGLCSLPGVMQTSVGALGWISVSSPYGGETWYTGETYTITWSSDSAGSYVDIELFDDSYYSSYQAIASYADNDGSYEWTIPSSLTAGSYYYILISTPDGSIYNSGGYFTIKGPLSSITITSPSGSETWYKGDIVTITWSSVNIGDYVDINVGDYVDIDLYENDYYYTSIATYVYNIDSYGWTIPSDLYTSSYYQIKITSSSDSSVYDYSEYFSITDATEPYISVSWLTDQTCYLGDTHTIWWDSSNAGDYVKIELYRDGWFYSTITTSTLNNGYYDWVVPESYDTGEYEIRVTSTSDKSVYGTSSLSIAPFFPNIFGGLTELTLILVAIVLIILIIIWKVTSKKKPVQQKIVTENNSRLQALKGKVNEWKKEGYDVKEIEDMMDSSETLKENKTSTNKTK